MEGVAVVDERLGSMLVEGTVDLHIVLECAKQSCLHTMSSVHVV